MNFIHRNFLGLFIVVMLVAGFMVSRMDAQEREDSLREDDVSSCIRENSRSAKVAAYQLRTAENRKEAGLANAEEDARDYRAFAFGMIENMALPEPDTDPLKMIEVERATHAGRPAYVLADSTVARITLGCRRAYGLD